MLAARFIDCFQAGGEVAAQQQKAPDKTNPRYVTAWARYGRLRRFQILLFIGFLPFFAILARATILGYLPSSKQSL